MNIEKDIMNAKNILNSRYKIVEATTSKLYLIPITVWR